MLNRSLDIYAMLENEQAPRYCALLLAAIFAIALSYSINHSFQAFTSQPKPNNTAAPAPTIIQGYKTQTITNLHLFGQLDAANEQRLDKLNLPKTQLQLVLKGVFTASDPALGSAIIEIPEQKTRTFNVNNTVYGNTKLHAVYRDRVVLSRSGQLETLYFPKANTDSNSNNIAAAGLEYSSADTITFIKDNVTLSDINSMNSALSSPTITAEQRQQLIRQRLQELRNRKKN